jgi:hypothetical protein
MFGNPNFFNNFGIFFFGVIGRRHRAGLGEVRGQTEGKGSGAMFEVGGGGVGLEVRMSCGLADGVGDLCCLWWRTAGGVGDLCCL